MRIAGTAAYAQDKQNERLGLEEVEENQMLANPTYEQPDPEGARLWVKDPGKP